MTTYYIYEVQNTNATCNRPEIYLGTLKAAKAKATRDQVFKGTLLKITDTKGNAISTKIKSKWHDYDYFNQQHSGE